MQLPLTDPDTLFEELLQDLPIESRVIQFSMEQLTGHISGAIKRFDPRGGSPGKAHPRTSQNAWMELRR
jgi:hypothetical protein